MAEIIRCICMNRHERDDCPVGKVVGNHTAGSYLDADGALCAPHGEPIDPDRPPRQAMPPDDVLNAAVAVTQDLIAARARRDAAKEAVEAAQAKLDAAQAVLDRAEDEAREVLGLPESEDR